MRTALTIAGSDPSGGAGIQADIKTFQAHGVYAMSAVTAITVQNTRKVYEVYDLPPDIVRGQIACLFDDIRVDAVKIGMVSDAKLIKVIADTLKRQDLPPVVLDPVMISKSGYKLLKPDAKDSLVKNLFPISDVVTPNIFEAEILCGRNIDTINGMKSAALEIIKIGAKNVVIKGGHLKNHPPTDLLSDGTSFLELKSERIDTKNTHGTGCSFSSAIAANMAKGKSFFESVKMAKDYITGAIRHSLALGKGHGPLNHFFNLY